MTAGICYVAILQVFCSQPPLTRHGEGRVTDGHSAVALRQGGDPRLGVR